MKFWFLSKFSSFFIPFCLLKSSLTYCNKTSIYSENMQVFIVANLNNCFFMKNTIFIIFSKFPFLYSYFCIFLFLPFTESVVFALNQCIKLFLPHTVSRLTKGDAINSLMRSLKVLKLINKFPKSELPSCILTMSPPIPNIDIPRIAIRGFNNILNFKRIQFTIFTESESHSRT